MGREKKYAVYPGRIPGAYDADFVGFHSLCNLYGVDPGECVNMRSNNFALRGMSRGAIEKLIPLRPRQDGNYALPEAPAPEIKLVNAAVYDLRNRESDEMALELNFSDGWNLRLQLDQGTRAGNLAGDLVELARKIAKHIQ